MKTIHLKEQLPDEDVELLLGQFVGEEAYDTLIQEDCDCFKPDGTPLLKFRRGVIPVEMCETTFPIWELAATPTDNRGMAAGAPELNADGTLKGLKKEYGKVITTGKAGATRFKFLKQDGTVAKKTVAKTVRSGIVGSMDNHDSRFPYCRLTAFSAQHMEKFNLCMPLITMVDRLFAELMPDRHKAQMEWHNRTSQDFKIPGTSFTTLTVNMTFRTAAHRDRGDLEQGFGVLCAIRKGNYRGGYLIFPKYRVAVDMQTTDLLCCDVHEVHANDKMTGIPGTYKRVSLVFYYRKLLASCGTAEQEREKAIAKTEAHYRKQGELEL